MKSILALAAVLCSAALVSAEPRKVFVTGLKHPIGVTIGAGGKIYVAVINDKEKLEAGEVLRVEGEKTVPFASGFSYPTAVKAFQQWLYVADLKGIWRIDPKGKSELVAPISAFPKPVRLMDLAIDGESGLIYVSEDREGKTIYRVTPRGKVDIAADSRRSPRLDAPEALAMDGASHIVVANNGTKEILRIRLADGTTEKLADSLGQVTMGLAFDHHGRLFVSNPGIHVIPRPGASPVELEKQDDLVGRARICLSASGKEILAVDDLYGTLTSIPISIPGHEVDETPLPLYTEVAFPDLKWTGWKGETDTGKVNTLRPIVLTHANDNSGRVFVATQHGVIHHFPNNQKANKTTVFLDIQDRVSYRDDQNEEGFLGLAFHPKFKDNGEFFVFYTTKKAKLTNVVSRFRVLKDDPTRADPDSEEQIMEFKKPFWNHDGGTILFGPDGYLYVTHGDGGAANDPYDNAQNMNRWLGKVLRIDVDSPKRISKQKNYAVPKDNPFVGTSACPEIWACGLRNIWRMAFDRKTGKLWAGDVGQNLFEEIDIIEKGGNYGWNRREGLHPFGPKGTGPRKDFIEPIWEYHHDVGKSIIGGTVYRGPRLPELDGMYLYGDYVSAKIWALMYDEAKGRVTANRPIKDRGLPMFSFGEDDKGEVYMLTPTTTGKGIYWFVK
jgi:glucose/arabinose dehydrogenase